MDVINGRVWRVFVPLYFVASTVVAALSPLLFGDLGVYRFRFLFGPLAYLAEAFPGAERRAASPAYPVVYEQAIFWYVFWTISLGLCLAITLRKKARAARVIGFSLAALIWIGSAAMIAALME